MTDSEKVVLGIVIECPSLLSDVADTGLSEADFGLETHQRIWRALFSLKQLGIPIDTYTVLGHLDVPESSDLAVLVDLIFGVVVTKAHAIWHARNVIRVSRLRQIAELGEWVVNAALEPRAEPELLIDAAIAKLQEVAL
jgi:replicative DNA helicase